MEVSQTEERVAPVELGSDQAVVERAARAANSRDLWDKLWKDEGNETWRKQALKQVYDRIVRLMPKGSLVIDLGGGVGALGSLLKQDKGADVLVVDHSEQALELAMAAGLSTTTADLENPDDLLRVTNFGDKRPVIVATEVVEHFSHDARQRLFKRAAECGHAFISVPNDRLGPDEEPQHTVKYNAMSFKRDLQKYFEHVRIEVLGPYLLGVCGWSKKFTLSVTMPCRDEAVDLEATLASFRAVADEIVIGIDQRTVDNTREVALKYADVVFDLVDPEGPDGDRVPNGGVHFAWIRNQCMDRCTGEWIFMTEAHERLVSGNEALLNLDQLPPEAKIGFVLRTGNDQQWAFPWLCKNDKRFRYARQTHNVLDYPAGTYAIQLPQVRTLHERHKDRELERQKQRKVQNRLTLLDDWVTHGNENSLHYLGAEWREHSTLKAIERLEEYMALPKKNGPQRYHTRLLLSKLYSQEGSRLSRDKSLVEAEREAQNKAFLKKARDVLMGAIDDDWSRTEHWVRLGDLAYMDEKLEEALQWYTYAGTKVGQPPFTLWWVDLPMYSWVPAQRLAMVYAELGRLDDSLYWARRVVEQLPDDAERSAFQEAQENITLLEDRINAGRGDSERAGAD
jgi:2-polyprenyl-3-methyl-5-hydroxy-6-metoxy-1,4-benzoquinol methylase/tetratricopeptide (TPR) repeat protein